VNRSFVLRQSGLHVVCNTLRGANGLRIGLIDGAINITHPALRDCRIQVAGQYDAAGAGDHATFGASILVSTDDARRAGTVMALCPDCTLIHMPVVSGAMLAGELSLRETAGHLAAAVDVLVRAKCRILLFGIAIERATHSDWSALRQALRTAAGTGVLAIVPAGNRPAGARQAPAPWDEVLTVASLDWRAIVSQFSRHGLTARHAVYAPGENVPGATGQSGFSNWSGSSAAAAIAAGAIALGCSAAPQHSPVEVARQLFPPPRRVLDGMSFWKSVQYQERERELSNGS
jgi:hypothetical protein